MLVEQSFIFLPAYNTLHRARWITESSWSWHTSGKYRKLFRPSAFFISCWTRGTETAYQMIGCFWGCRQWRESADVWQSGCMFDMKYSMDCIWMMPLKHLLNRSMSVSSSSQSSDDAACRISLSSYIAHSVCLSLGLVSKACWRSSF